MTNRVLFTALLVVLCANAQMSAADKLPPSEFCDQILPLATVIHLLGKNADSLVRSTVGFVPESEERCSRIYAKPNSDRFSDELMMLVTVADSAEGALASLEQRAEKARGYKGYSRPRKIGKRALAYRRPDPLSQIRKEFNMTFVVDKYLIELKYQSVDDGKQNKFMHRSSELVPVARTAAANLNSVLKRTQLL